MTLIHWCAGIRDGHGPEPDGRDGGLDQVARARSWRAVRGPSGEPVTAPTCGRTHRRAIRGAQLTRALGATTRRPTNSGPRAPPAA